MRIPTRLDRYPAKMVFRLADTLVQRYASNAERLLDPFSGSGAILLAAHKRGIPVSGVDLNPISALFSSVKIRGFSPDNAYNLARQIITIARETKAPFPVNWRSKYYWFTPSTLDKYERLRAACRQLDINNTRDGQAVLLGLALSIRLCSKADQRSPKPFISKQAIETRKGIHFDPYSTLLRIVKDLSNLYGNNSNSNVINFIATDITSDSTIAKSIGLHTHVITSPPYINAQDYFRNFKLELYLLEYLLPYEVDHIRNRFIGTERGNLLSCISEEYIERYVQSLPYLHKLHLYSPRLASVVYRYIHDMDKAFEIIKYCLTPNASFILVCGDNLIGGIRIKTWRILQELLVDKGFRLYDQYSDEIENRLLAPKRCGHKGLIKEEVISAFRLS
jgi:hypothetical protein